jgi:monosaccharide-transporting ATPase
MPGTCEPEGYLAEKRKGNVRTPAGGAKTTFATQFAFIDGAHAAAAARSIKGD